MSETPSKTLHTVNKSPFERNALVSCLDHARPGDPILLIEDGVVAARRGSNAAATLGDAARNGRLYVLGPDMAARGLGEDQLVNGARVVDYGGFVDLAASCARTLSWL
jgi:tRNA 2-thiouridine synthesizing protein B